MAMSADGSLLAFASTHDKAIRLYDAKSGKPIGMLNGHGSGVNGLSTSPSGQFVASTSDDKTRKRWKVS
jgi:WD40 repeat protein